MTPRAKYIFASPIVCVTKELAAFLFDIIPVHPHMTYKTY